MNDTIVMTPLNAHLLRALLGWIEANQMTPHILVDGTVMGVKVPMNSIKDGKVVLNMAGGAISRLEISDYHVSFSTRFNGSIFEVNLPMSSVLSVYTKETGQGMQLPPMAHDAEAFAMDEAPSAPTKQDKRAHLRVVK